MSVALAPESEQHAAPVDPAAAYRYRALNSAAVASAVLGVLSVLCFLGWFLAVVPFFGLLLGLFATRQIKSRGDEFVGLGLARTGVVLSAGLWAAGWGALGYRYVTEVPDGFDRISYSQLQPADPSARLIAPPESAVVLNGKKVFIKGYMYPDQRSYDIQSFLLCRDKGDCCFGGNPKVTDRVQIHLPPGKTIDYTQRQIDVWGEFVVADSAASNGLGGGVIYHLKATDFRG